MKVDVPGQGKVIGFYGEDHQSLVACEELGELVRAVSKMRRAAAAGENDWDAYENLVEEISDVLIILEQLKEMYQIPNHEIQAVVFKKCARQEERMHDSV